MPENTTVIGTTVFLRHPHEDGMEEFIALNQASTKLHRGKAAPPITREQFETYLERADSPGSVCFFVCLVKEGAIIGSINLSQIFLGGFRSAYLGYYVGARYSGRGYMTEAIQLLLRHAFVTLRLHRIEANIQPGNTASIALVRRAGFTKEGFSRRYLKIAGRWRDHERWAILAEDWKSISGRRTITPEP